jgi:DNA-binding NtrC family response regulator
MLNVLIIEDESLFARSVMRRLQREGHQAQIAESIAEGRRVLDQGLPDVVLMDVRLPDGNGLDLLSWLRQSEGEAKQLPIIVMTAYGELEAAVSAMKMGATDYLKKPVDLDELMLTLNKVMQSRQLSQKLDYSQIRESHASDRIEMVGQSEAIQAFRNQLQRIASMLEKSNEDHPVLLINGETGTGKDVAARLFHQIGAWRDRPFVHIDCSSLPAELIEAELFGYERGAFTNAHQAKAGLVEVAEDGTLFLDEVGELPLDLQAKLLNVLERRKVRRLGSTREHPVKAHLVAATNRDLQAMVEAGEFRSDLFFRLNVLQLNLPALRDRSADIALLAEHFLRKLGRRYGLSSTLLNDSVLQRLQAHHWPGNVRELLHVLERAVMLSHNGELNAEDLLLPVSSVAQSNSGSSPTTDLESMTLEQVEKILLEKALQRTQGNVSQAARDLGLTRMAMRYRMEKYQL